MDQKLYLMEYAQAICRGGRTRGPSVGDGSGNAIH